MCQRHSVFNPATQLVYQLSQDIYRCQIICKKRYIGFLLRIFFKNFFLLARALVVGSIFHYQIRLGRQLSYYFSHPCRNAVLVPAYLTELRIPVSSLPGCSSLRSTTQGNLIVPLSFTATAQHGRFAVIDPSFCNTCNLLWRV